MQQSELERAVAQATGETRDTIRQRGFTLLEIPETTEDEAPYHAPQCSAESPSHESCVWSPWPW